MIRIILTLLTGILFCSANALTPGEFEKKSGLGREMRYAEKRLKDLYEGKGSVVYGRIIADPAVIRRSVSRIGVTPRGYFVREVYRGRNLCFYLHGYAPLCIPVRANAPQLLDAGNITFIKLPPDKTFSVKGKVTETEALKGKEICVTLWLEMPPQVFRDDGYAGGHVNEKIAEKFIKDGETFQFDGLSPVKYRVDIKTDNSMIKQVFFNNTGVVGEFEYASDNASCGCCGQVYCVPKPVKKQLKSVELPEICLVAAPRVRLSLLTGRVDNVQYNHVPTDNIVPPVFGERVKVYERICDGSTFIPIVSRAEYYGSKFGMQRNYRLNLEIDKKNRIVPFFGFGISRFYDFGKTTLEKVRQEVNTEFMKKSRAPKVYSYRVGDQVMSVTIAKFKDDIALKDGHVYYFEYPGGNVYFLLKIDFISSPDK